MKKLVILLCVFIGSTAFAQEKKSNFFKEVYNDFLKYGTFYAAGNVGNAKMENKEYFVRTNPDDLYAIPDVVDETVYRATATGCGFSSNPTSPWTPRGTCRSQTHSTGSSRSSHHLGDPCSHRVHL